MNLPLMSSSALDTAVYELIVRELGVANAMRFIARHNHTDGVDYTKDRTSWLASVEDALDKSLTEPNEEFERLVRNTRQKKAPR